MTNFTAEDIRALANVMDAEELACKKARLYARTLTDAALADEMERIALAHAGAFSALYSLLGGKA